MTPDPRLLRVLAPFGVTPADLPTPPDPAPDARRLLAALEPGSIALITGPSGSGKSRLLDAVRRAGDQGSVIRDRGRGFGAGARSNTPDPRSPIPDPRGDQPPVAALCGHTFLAAAGLADARLLAAPAAELSEGESARLRLALAMQANEGRLLLADEFCSTLDRATAAGVAASLHRWARRTKTRAVVATAHEDMPRLLGPDLIARCDAGSMTLGPGPGRPRPPAIRIEPGARADLAALSGHHYRPGPPASPCRVLRATIAGRLAGVLVACHPTLNGAWRELAWPERYAGDRRRAAHRLNRELRRIARVIVHPRDRGRGVATALVRAYLADPATPATEAVAAMGALSPFFERAGMTAYPLPPRPNDDRLADMLHALDLEPWRLLDPAGVDPGSLPLLRRELAVWARATPGAIPKPLRRWTDPMQLAPVAAARLTAPPIAYAHAR